MAAKLTPWFPSHQKPKRKGVYETNFVDDLTGYSHWDGGRWSHEWRSVASAYAHLTYPGDQDKRWRGLARRPSRG